LNKKQSKRDVNMNMANQPIHCMVIAYNVLCNFIERLKNPLERKEVSDALI
jgi:hypothetical protein